MGCRLLVAAPHERPQVKSPADAANLLMLEMGALEQEHLRTVILDTKNHVLKIHTVTPQRRGASTHKNSSNSPRTRLRTVVQSRQRYLLNHPGEPVMPVPRKRPVTVRRRAA